MVAEQSLFVTDAIKDFYSAYGYAVVKGLFTPEEAAHYREHYMNLRHQGSHPGDFSGVDTTHSDPLKKYPRLIHMHRWDEISLRWLLDARINTCITSFLGREPYAAQTMLYFKPAGARGQALHQDNFYLRVHPGPAWRHGWRSIRVMKLTAACR